MSLDTPLEARRAARSVSTPTMAIVGATGAVGVELLHCLEQRGFPLASLRLLASPRSAGREMPFRGRTIIVEAVDCEMLLLRPCRLTRINHQCQRIRLCGGT
jgi:aspartate-semialdehyde dehydrogenase